MKTQSTHSRLLAAAATAVLLGAFCQNVSATGFVPVRLHTTATIQSAVPIGGDEYVVTMEVLATDVGWGNVFGPFTSVLHLVVDFDVATGLPLRGGGEVVQTNADGSTVIWENHFEGTQTGSRIIGGTGRFRHAQGWVRGEAVLNEDGTVSTKESGWITSLGSNRLPEYR
jgi:hypothetical protein